MVPPPHQNRPQQPKNRLRYEMGEVGFLKLYHYPRRGSA